MREKEIDAALHNLVSLKDGKQDELGEILDPAIKALKEFRRQRAIWRESAKRLHAIKRLTKSSDKMIEELRQAYHGRKKHAKRK